MSRVYVIDWLDHCDLGANQAWTDVDKIESTAPLIRTIGFIVKETKDGIVVAHTLHDGQASTPFLILKSAIIRKEVVKLPPLRRKPKTS